MVIPCYNEELTANKFYVAILPVLTEIGCDFELIFINDGSKDNTYKVLKGLALNDSRVKVINFSRNFGQQSAILSGLKASTGDVVIPIDCDLQDPVEVIPLMIDKWKQGYQVVHGRRISRKGETGFKKSSASMYYRFLNKISQTEIPENTGDFKLLDRRVVDIIIGLPEHNKYLRGLESWVGFNQTFVDFKRNERVAGKTNYTLKKMFSLAKDGIMSNSYWPLKFFMGVGIFITGLSFLGLIGLIVLQIVVKGFNPLWWILPVNGLIGGLLMVSKGVSDLYLMRVYDESKNRPEYIIQDKINF